MAHGFSETKLKNLTPHIQKYVDSGKLPGVACLVSRRGEEAYFHAYGYRDVERQLDVSRDTIFRIYSMSKPITSVALMMLYETGLFQLDDSVSKYIPGWADLSVYQSGSGGGIKTEPCKTPVTIKHLLTHTSGLTYGFMNSDPVDALYREKGIGSKGTLNSMMEDLASVPLLFQPGSRWNYSVSTDVCGALVEHFSKQDLDVFVRENITGPLNMNKTGYQVHSMQADSFAACYQFRKEGGYILSDDPENSSYLSRPTFFSGGGGMVSTIDDYQRFAQMLLNKGELEGARVLGRKTVEYMSMNHMPGNVDLAAMGQPVFSETPYEGIGFGLGFSCRDSLS